jgi:hypothetical protein
MIKVGTNSNNTLTGTAGADLMLGLGGNDLIRGQGGDDVLCGGDGVDLVQGFGGNDSIFGDKGNDVLNGGAGDYDVLIDNDGNDVLLDGDGVQVARSGVGNDLVAIVLRKGWRANGQPRFTDLSAGYGNDAVGLAILDSAQFFVNITGDEYDNPASPQEGNNDGLVLIGVIDLASKIDKFEHQIAFPADADSSIPSEDAGAEYLTEPVGEGTEAVQANRVFLPVVTK